LLLLPISLCAALLDGWFFVLDLLFGFDPFFVPETEITVAVFSCDDGEMALSKK
jgi:hypothetical protein